MECNRQDKTILRTQEDSINKVIYRLFELLLLLYGSQLNEEHCKTVWDIL